MSHDVFYHFPQTPVQARRCGARGGKATARNGQSRRAAAVEGAQPPASAAKPQVQMETTAAAIALLDAHYPWLQGAEQRFSKGSRPPRV